MSKLYEIKRKLVMDYGPNHIKPFEIRLLLDYVEAAEIAMPHFGASGDVFDQQRLRFQQARCALGLE